MRDPDNIFILPNVAFQSPNVIKAFEEASSMMRGLVDGSVRCQYPSVATTLTVEKSARVD